MQRIYKRTWYTRVLVALLTVGGVASIILYADFRAFMDTPLELPEQGLTLVVEPGKSMAAIAQRLRRQAGLRVPLYWQLYAHLTGSASRIRAGEYAITRGATPRTLLAQLVSGRVMQHALTIVEGWTFRQMLAAIAGHEKLKHTLRGLDDAAIMARLGHPGEHPEGRFFPDTYYFPAGTSDLAFLRRAYATLEQRLSEAWQRRASQLPLQSPYQALVLASIIEKETALPSERREIAGVFIRRLQKDMLLQTDPTVIYGLGEAFDGDIRRRDLLADTPYNTYVRKGLPPTPIALPGADSLTAAVNPAPGDALYFVATGAGGHVFSRTLEEHNQAVRQYQLNRR